MNLSLLKCHPFPVVAHFDKVVAVTFAFPEVDLIPMLAAGLTIDSYEGYGFVTAALVWTRQLRPEGFPAVLGKDFFLVGYRIFTCLRVESGRKLRGLQILRSETDKRSMVVLGNLMTQYHYRHVQVEIRQEASTTLVRTALPDGTASLELAFSAKSEITAPPAGSPFPDYRTARRFAGPMPYTFSPRGDGSFLVIEGRRADWKPRPIQVNHWKIGLFDEAGFRGKRPILANAFQINDVAYRWSKGRIVWPGGGK